MIRCTGGGCTPDTNRYRDPVLARVKALEHLRQHVACIGKPRHNARCRCRCRHQECTWHAGQPVGSGSPMMLVLIRASRKGHDGQASVGRED